MKLVKLFEKGLRLLLGQERFEDASGDLMELYTIRKTSKGNFLATCHYVLDVLASARNAQIKWTDLSLIRQYLVVSTRRIRKGQTSFAFRLLSLTIGFSGFLFLLSVVSYEKSFDQFHEHHKDIYRVVSDIYIDGQAKELATSPTELGPFLHSHFPEVQKYFRLFRHENKLFKFQGESLNADHFLAADTMIYQILDFDWHEGGNPKALKRPGTITISESLKKRLFGEAPATGKIISLAGDNWKMEVVGVFRDFPSNSHLKANAIVGLHIFNFPKVWNEGLLHHTYVQLKEGSSLADLSIKVKPALTQHLSNMEAGIVSNIFQDFSISFQRLSTIHLQSHRDYEINPNGSELQVDMLLITGWFLLIVGYLNFANLSFNSIVKRHKEIGIRRAFGSSKLALFSQFFWEVLLFAVAVAVTIWCLLWFFWPLILRETQLPIERAWLTKSAILIPYLSVILIPGIISAFYMAFVCTKLSHTETLTNSRPPKISVAKGQSLLVTLQFSIAIIAILFTILVSRQMRFIQEKDLGYSVEGIAIMEMPLVYPHQQFQPFMESLRLLPSLKQASNVSFIPGEPLWTDSYEVQSGGTKQEVLLREIFADHGFFEALDINIHKGRAFDSKITSDATGAFIVNKSCERSIFQGSALGQSIRYAGDPDSPNKWNGKVVGVVSDLHTASLHQVSDPVVIRLPWSSAPLPYVYIKFSNDMGISPVIEKIEKRYREIIGNYPMELIFLDDVTRTLYRKENLMNLFVKVATAGMVCISFLGLVGLVQSIAAQKKRELVIRNILGAGILANMKTFSGRLIQLTLIANLLSFPIAYYLIHSWLTSFAFRVQVGWETFVLVCIASTQVVLLVVFTQLLHIYRQSFTEVLREE